MRSDIPYQLHFVYVFSEEFDESVYNCIYDREC